MNNQAIKFPHVGGKPNNVIFFPNCNPKKKTIPMPKRAKPADRFCEFEIENNRPKIGFSKGDLLTCRINFDLSEITPNTVCVVRIESENRETVGKADFNSKGEIVSFTASRKYPPEDVEILAIAVELRKSLKI